jgi:hypothetical protein
VKIVNWLVILILALGITRVGTAQGNETALTGTILDTTGARVSGATVIAVNTDTNASRATITSGAGTYYIGNLSIGNYRLVASAQNFSKKQVSDILLSSGQTRTLDVRLDIERVAEEINVIDEAPPLAATTAEIGSVVEAQQIKDLPLNGRNIASVLALVPGAIDSGGGSLSSIRFAGRGNDDTNFRLDGIDASGIRAQNPSTTLRLQNSTESIAEVKVTTLLYGADTGGTAGGQVEMVSKSGTNQFHGGVFDYLRNNYFDSMGPYDLKTPNLKLNNFGASLGGPVRKDKTFFFGSYEGIQQIVSTYLVAKVPSDAYRAQVLAASPALAPFLNAYPHGNGAAIDANSIFYDAPGSTQQTENSYLGRGQQIFDDKNNLVVRYRIDIANITAPSGVLRDLSVTDTSPMNATVQYVHVFTPTLLNEASLGFNRARSLGTTSGYLSQTQNIPYALSVSGLTALTNTKASLSAPSTYSLIDNLTETYGRHTIKAGIELKEVHFNYSQAGVHQLQYNGYTQFLTNKLDSVSVVADVPVHGLHKMESFGYAQDTFKMRPNLTFTLGMRYEFFNVLHEVHGRSQAWDDETCGPTAQCPVGGQFTIPVTTNFEPRFSFGWEPAIAKGKTVIRGGAGVYHGEAQLGDLNAPSDNFTTLFGLTPAAFPGLSWPVDSFVAQAALNPQAVQPRGLQRDRLDPRVTQYGLQIQTAMPYRFILDTGYIGSWGDHQFYRTYRNNYLYGTTIRPYPGFGQVDYKEAEGTTNFNAWQTSLQRQFRNGLGIQFNYMYSHALNDGSTGGGEGDYPNNVACMHCEYASSDQDATHVISADAIYTLPLGHGQKLLKHGVASAILGGISMDSIFSSRTGLPINVVLSRPASAILDGNNTEHSAGSPNLRPNLVPGVSLTPPGGRSSLPGGQWINPAAFAKPADGTWGNAPRNLVRGPGLWQSDLGTGKRFLMGERVSGELKAEIFNIFNRSQYANPSSNFTSVSNAIDAYNLKPTSANAAAVTSAEASFSNTTAVVNGGATGGGTPRRIQFALRFTY